MTESLKLFPFEKQNGRKINSSSLCCSCLIHLRYEINTEMWSALCYTLKQKSFI